MNITKFFLIIFFLYSFLYTNIFAKNSFFAEGEKLYKEKKFSQSKFKFEKDIVFNPKNEKSYLYLAKIFNYQKDDFMEEQNLNTVILLNPRNEEALLNLAKLKLNSSDYKKSKELNNKLHSLCNKFCVESNKLKTEIENLSKK